MAKYSAWFGLAEDFHRRTGGGADEANAHRHVAHLREGVRLHGFAKALESLACRFQGGVAQQHHKFLAAETQDTIVAAERAAQQVGHEDQHFVAVKVAKAVVDLLEVVDIDDGQPLLAWPMLFVGARGAGLRALRQRGRGCVAGELLVEGLRLKRPVSASRSL